MLIPWLVMLSLTIELSWRLPKKTKLSKTMIGYSRFQPARLKADLIGLVLLRVSHNLFRMVFMENGYDRPDNIFIAIFSMMMGAMQSANA
jgi:hypothetical protein